MRRVACVLAVMSFAVMVQGQTTSTDQRERADAEPLTTLALYFGAINARDYRRAYRFWDSPPSPFEQFARGFADTNRVRLLVDPSARIEGAAGSAYAEISTIVVATTRSGNERVFAGCYVLRRSNVQDRGWQLYRADVSQVPLGTRLLRILSHVCRN